jgi:hypothetical protein
MSAEIQTIPLWPLTPPQAQRLIDTAARRQIEADLGLGDRPGGMRLSTPCPTRRVKAVHDARLRFTLDPALARRGFLAEDLMEAAGLLDDCELQVELPWGDGSSSAWDAIRADGTPVSIKSVSRDERGGKPTSANRAQDLRMLAADPQRGTRVEVWMVNMGRMEATGPHWHEFTPEEILAEQSEMAAVITAARVAAALDHEAAMVDWWDDAEWWLKMGLECTCGGCFPREAFDANAAIERHVTTWAVMSERIADAKQMQDAARTAMTAAADLLGVDHVHAHTRAVTLKKTKAGVWRVTARAEATA